MIHAVVLGKEDAVSVLIREFWSIEGTFRTLKELHSFWKYGEMSCVMSGFFINNHSFLVKRFQ